MGRAEDRKKKRIMAKKVGKEGLERIIQASNDECVKQEVQRQCKFFEDIVLESTVEALNKNGISTTKAKQIIRDIENMILRRCYSNAEVKKELSQ